MTINLDSIIRKELAICYRHGRDAGSPSGSLATEAQVVDSGTEQIVKAVKQWMLTKEGMTVATMVGFEAGKGYEEVSRFVTARAKDRSKR